MVNLEHKLTIDDLIVEYLMYRIKNGYNPEFLTSDFIEFLRFFETKMEVEDTIYDGVPLFKRFFARKAAQDWSYDCPHMDMIYCVTDYDYIIRANYKFSAFDENVVNTYFMSKEMKTKIRKIIGEYLDNYPKF